jgi:hypothetical protein
MIRRTPRAALQLLGAENRLQGSPGFQNRLLEWNVTRGLQDFAHISILHGSATWGTNVVRPSEKVMSLSELSESSRGIEPR